MIKSHSHDHSGEKLSIKTFNQFYYIPHLPLRFSIFIDDCFECPTNEHFPIKPQNNSPSLPFYENATHFNYRISMDTKGPFSPSSQKNSYIFVIIDAFSHFVGITQLLTLLLNMQFKLFFIIGLQNLDPNNISLLTEVLNIRTKITPIYALFSILITHLVLHTLPGQMV